MSPAEIGRIWRQIDDRAAELAGSADLRLGLIRIALRRRENIPVLLVFALQQDERSRRIAKGVAV